MEERLTSEQRQAVAWYTDKRREEYQRDHPETEQPRQIMACVPPVAGPVGVVADEQPCPKCGTMLAVVRRGIYSYPQSCPTCDVPDLCAGVFGGLSMDRDVSARMRGALEARATGVPQERKEQERIKGLLREWVNNPVRWLTLAGKSGAGKSHFAAVSALVLARRGRRVRWAPEDVLYFVAQNRKSFDDRIRWWCDGLLSSIKRADIVCLDDLGRCVGSKDELARLVELEIEILQHARLCQVMLVTSNCLPGALREVRGESIVGWLGGNGDVRVV